MKNWVLAPSLLSADFGRLREEIEMINSSQADWLHLDIMDGRFVPNISFGFPVLHAIRKWCTIPLDIHLMIVEPDIYLSRFLEYSPRYISVHFEACIHLHRTLHFIKQNNCKAGVALNPHTDIDVLKSILPDIDMVCMMSVNPGFGGQKFIEHTYSKISRLCALRTQLGSAALIEIDGGVDNHHSTRLLDTGADVLVVGNSIFATDNPLETIRIFKNL